jgi:hypothetical protein
MQGATNLPTYEILARLVIYISVPQPVFHKVKGVTRTFTYCKKLIVNFVNANI